MRPCDIKTGWYFRVDARKVIRPRLVLKIYEGDDGRIYVEYEKGYGNESLGTILRKSFARWADERGRDKILDQDSAVRDPYRRCEERCKHDLVPGSEIKYILSSGLEPYFMEQSGGNLNPVYRGPFVHRLERGAVLSDELPVIKVTARYGDYWVSYREARQGPVILKGVHEVAERASEKLIVVGKDFVSRVVSG